MRCPAAGPRLTERVEAGWRLELRPLDSGEALAVTSPPSRSRRAPAPREAPVTAVAPAPTSSLAIVARRRRQRAIAMVVALLPLPLFALAAIPRLWSANDAPFGLRQAAALTEAQRATGMTAVEVWAGDPPIELARVLHALLFGGEWVEAWVVVLCLADSLAAVLVFLAARALLGVVPAIAAGGLYAASPWAWSLARDPAGSGLPLLAATGLAIAVRLVRRPSLPGGVALAVLGALLVRADPLGLLVLPVLAVALVAARPTWSRLVVGLALFAALAGPVLPSAVSRLASAPLDGEVVAEAAAPLRFWRSVADAAAEGSELVEAPELTLLAAEGAPPDAGAILASLLPRRPVRELPPGVVPLPIERPTLYLSWAGGSGGDEGADALTRPSARLGQIPLPETGIGVHLTALRPRPVAQWLAGVPQPPGGERRFADGSTLVGTLARPGRAGGPDRLELYWRFEPVAGGGPAAFVELAARPAGSIVARAALPGPRPRRRDELVVQTVVLPRRTDDGATGLSLSLVTEIGEQVVSADGLGEVVVGARGAR